MKLTQRWFYFRNKRLFMSIRVIYLQRHQSMITGPYCRKIRKRDRCFECPNKVMSYSEPFAVP